MIHELKQLLQNQEVTRAVVVDDAFDESPRPADVEDILWDRFFDDLGEDEEREVKSAFGEDTYDASDPSDLRRNQAFIHVLWHARSDIGSAGSLFQGYVRDQSEKRDVLRPLCEFLERDLELSCRFVGRDQPIDDHRPQIVFLDLYLGMTDDESAAQAAIDRVKHLVRNRQDNPPSVVLMSASPNLLDIGPRLRDEAELLGCQFRMIPKRELSDDAAVTDVLYDLIVSYPDGLKLNGFLYAWKEALERAKGTFLKSIRTLDLPDYANMQRLILDAEGQPVGDYVLDLYDLHLHNVLESDDVLVRAAKSLNEIEWEGYPPAQFMPSPEALGIMDGALLHNQRRTDIEAEHEAAPGTVRLGDIFLGPEETPAADGGADGNAPGDRPGRYAYVVLSQACDLQHGDTDRILLLKGRVRPYHWGGHGAGGQAPRTPLMYVGEEPISIEWDVLSPETWLMADLQRRLEQGFRRVRRLRTPFALQLQQSFVGRLARVGTLATLPARHCVGIRVFLRKRSGRAELLAQAGIDEEDAVCLVGRTIKNTVIDWLLLSERIQKEIRRRLTQVESTDLPTDGAAKIADLIGNPEFYRCFKRGLQFNRGAAKGTKPFQDTRFDVIQIVTTCDIENGGEINRSFRPITIAVDIE